MEADRLSDIHLALWDKLCLMGTEGGVYGPRQPEPLCSWWSDVLCLPGSHPLLEEGDLAVWVTPACHLSQELSPQKCSDGGCGPLRCFTESGSPYTMAGGVGMGRGG